MKKFMIFFAIIVLCIICLVIGGFLGVYITFDNGEKFCENLVQDTDNEQKAEDEDIVAVVRTAMNDADNFHNSNAITFHRFRGFREKYNF